MNKRLHKTASLVLIQALPDFVRNRQVKGREAGLFERLQKEATFELGFCKKLKKKDQAKIKVAIDRFFEDTGWFKKSLKPRTYMAFLILVISDYGWRKLEGILLDIIEYNERILPETRTALCDHAGERAYKIWKEMKT